MNEKISQKLKTTPFSPGVYFHKSADGEVIYVGKAAVLRNRLRQYFQSRKDMDSKTKALVNEIADFDWIETESELDALFLESEMIKRYKPKWNILLRDDKSPTFLRINLKDDLPAVSFTRQPTDDGAEYFGPFYSKTNLKKAMRLLRRVFPYYLKNQSVSKLDYQLGLSPGVVEGGTSLEDYKKSLRQLMSYARGNRRAVQREIEANMSEAAKNKDFESAAKYRNQLLALAEFQKQNIFGREEFANLSKDQALADMQTLLNLDKIPRRIEGFDISHHGGKNVVASMVVFSDGLADRAKYRKFKLHNQANNDTANMHEIIERRLKHLSDWGEPSLILLDGGENQLRAVANLLDEAGIAFFGRNKSGDHGRNAKVTIVLPEKDAFRQIELDSKSHLAKLIARIDEEAHRFAITYHSQIKRSTATKNRLEEIPGIGPATRRKLLRHFGSLKKIAEADKAEIAEVIGQSKANTLIQSNFLLK